MNSFGVDLWGMKNMFTIPAAIRPRCTAFTGFLAKCFLAFVFGITVAAAESVGASSRTQVFCGSSPCDEPIRQIFGISTNGAPELIQWKLTLYRDPKTLAPTRYELHCNYGATAPNNPGIASPVKTLERQGTWRITQGTEASPDALTYDLQGAFSVCQINSNILQILNPDRTLMIGNGGWSCTLNSAAHAEKTVDPALARTVPDMSYQISPLATGPTVFGVFEGRTPAHGIARELKISLHPAATKAKWRVTLYQDPDTQAPTTYKIEGTLFRPNAREGKWTIQRAANANVTIYELASASEPTLRLVKGDDNVLFFLDQNRAPLVGHCEFSYSLNRRTDLPAISPAERRT